MGETFAVEAPGTLHRRGHVPRGWLPSTRPIREFVSDNDVQEENHSSGDGQAVDPAHQAATRMSDEQVGQRMER